MDYAKKNGYLHPVYFIDNGYSGTSFNRPAFSADLENQREAAQQELGKPFPQEAELREKSARLAEHWTLR